MISLVVKDFGLPLVHGGRSDRARERPLVAESNPAFERTAASALRLLAVPSSLRSSAAAKRER